MLRTPLHDIQLAAGGISANFGDWERIAVFGDPEAEAATAHESASDIRVKLGRDAIQQTFPKPKWTGDQKSPFEITRVLNPNQEAGALRKTRKNFNKRFPGLAGTEFVETWSGMIDATPDVVPVMDEISTCPGLFLATGFSGHGFGIGPGAGRVLADLVYGNPPGHDLSRFRFSRFSDGSKMRPGPAI